MRTILSLLTIVLVRGDVTAAEPPNADDLERAAVAARKGIRSGYLEFTVTYRWMLDGQPTTYISERKTWFDGHKIRAEYVFTKGPDQDSRMLECRNCERDGWGITATDRPGVVSSFDPLDTPGRPELLSVVDPRVLGYAPSIYATLSKEPVHKIFDSSVAVPKTVSSVRDRDTDCYDIRWVSKANVSVLVRVDPTRGHNISRIELASSTGKRAWRVVMASELSLSDGVWFPSRIVFTGAGGDVETTEVRQFRPNLPIPPEMFTLVGAQLKPNASVMLPNLPYTATIRDGKLDTSPPAQARFTDTSPPVPLTPPGRQVSPWLVSVCVACAVGAVVALFLRRRRGA